MARSLKKGPYVDPKLVKKIDKINDAGKKQVIKTWSRSCLLYTSPSPRDATLSRMPSSA